jgi:hypothetical protein
MDRTIKLLLQLNMKNSNGIFVMAMSGLSTRRLNLLQQFASLILQQFHNNEAAQIRIRG